MTLWKWLYQYSEICRLVNSLKIQALGTNFFVNSEVANYLTSLLTTFRDQKRDHFHREDSVSSIEWEDPDEKEEKKIQELRKRRQQIIKNIEKQNDEKERPR